MVSEVFFANVLHVCTEGNLKPCPSWRFSRTPVQNVCIWGRRMVIRAAVRIQWEREVLVPSVPVAEVKSSQSSAFPR